MRRVWLAGLEAETSCMGFGCASLGSRVAPAEGVRALGAAFDSGVTWFDVAPSYGDGRAESILGGFVAGRRAVVQVCTKVGKGAPRRSPLYRALLPAARSLVAAVPALRRGAAGASGRGSTTSALTPTLIQASIAQSLADLRTDYVDLLALHMPDPEALARADLLDALAAVLRRGQARAIGVAGSTAAALVAANLGTPYSVVQLADDPTESPMASIRSAAGGRRIGAITHSVFGVAGALAAARGRLRADPGLIRRLAELGYSGPAESVAADVLLDRALAANTDGVVLASMFDKRHLAFNVARASAPVSSVAEQACAAILN
jgi:aryl-alcohol dehydrogenase-like predicted oxidoreductase